MDDYRQREKQKIIQRPPKIYLDTSHLIYIARLRKGRKLGAGQSEEAYRRIDECIRSYCGLIFNPYAALEWVGGKATSGSANKIAMVLDSAKLKYVLEADYLVYTRDILDQCHKQDPNIKVPDFPVLQKLSDNCTICSALNILATQVPDYLEKDKLERLQQRGKIDATIPFVSVQQWVKETMSWKEKNPETYQERIDGFKASLSEDIARRNEYFADRQSYRKAWLKRFLKIDRILRALNPGIDADGVLGRIDVKDSQAVDLYWTVREKRMMSGNPPKDNDVDDYGSLAVVPHADVVLTERNLRAFILQADRSLESKVFHKPTDALKALESHGFSW